MVGMPTLWKDGHIDVHGRLFLKSLELFPLSTQKKIRLMIGNE